MAAPSTEVLLFLTLLAQVAALSSIQVTGVTRPDDTLNGVYRPTAEVINGYPAYKQDGYDNWLVTDLHGYWSIQPTAKKGSAEGFMIGMHKKLPNPEFETAWQLWRGSSWTVQPAVLAVPLAQTPRTVSSNEWRWAICFLVFGGFALVLGGLLLAHSKRPVVRAYWYNTLSDTVSCMIGILFAEAIILCCKRGNAELGTATTVLFPHQFSQNVHSSGWLIRLFFIPLIIFLVLNLVMSFLGWKFQFSYIRLLVVCTPMAMAVGFLGFYTFSIIRSLVPIPEPWNSILFAVLALLVIFIMKFIMNKIRFRTMAQPPAKAWPPAPKVSVVVAKTQRACGTLRSCDAFATKPHAETETEEIFADASGFDWDEYVRYAEVEVGSVILALLIYAACFAWSTEQSIKACLIRVLIFVVVVAALLAGGLAMKKREDQWSIFPEYLLLGTVARFCGVCIVGGLSNIMLRFLLDYFFAMVIVTLSLSALALLFILILGMTTPESSLHSQSYIRAPPSWTQPLSSWACVGVGIMLAIPWTELLTQTLGVAVGGTAFWEDDKQWAKAPLCLAIAVGLSFYWALYIAPKADHGRGLHQEEIEMEHAHFLRVDPGSRPGSPKC